MNNDYILVAVTNNESKVLLVRNVTKDEYNRLLNQQEKYNNEQIAKDKELEKTLNKHFKSIVNLKQRDLYLAKSIYDNFVDRGLIENDDQFQQEWFDYFFGAESDELFNIEHAPKEYVKILEKVEKWYEK